MKLRDLWRYELEIIQNWWREILEIIILILVGIVGILILAGIVWLVTGKWPDWTGFIAKILLDLMQLLIIPIGLAIVVYWLNEYSNQRKQAAETEKTRQWETEIAEKRAETERNMATDNRQEAALQTYLDRMAELLLDKKLRESEVVSEVRAVAWARTSTVLRRLDTYRKGAVLRFLYEADLIHKDKTVINLSQADLNEADLSGANLCLASLIGANLIGANLIGANLYEANLIGANLSGANLYEASLIGAWLHGANLSGANLSGANLSGAKYTKNSVSIQATTWPDGFDPDAAGAIRDNK